jgi:deoxycytidine triphosphate deaminase
MYLADTELKEKLKEMNIVSDSTDQPFSAQEQIQPCSIDLRLSNVFWIPRRIKSLDLRKSALLELDPRRYWRKKVLKSQESITIRPGQLILGRVSEKFSIPTDCAGKIEGRSSFSRLGLGVHCTGDFINPGYRGHMPVELYNYSPNSIRIYPYLPICQLKLVGLTSVPSKLYGIEELQSKYMDDDGGPSYWWRDKRIKRLEGKFAEVCVEIATQKEILNHIGSREPEIIERFERCVAHFKDPQKENCETLLQEFMKSERRLRIKDRIVRGISLALAPLLVSASIGYAFSDNYSTVHYLLWTVTLLSVFPFIYFLADPPKSYLTELQQ